MAIVLHPMMEPFVERIAQYGGLEQVNRRVKVKVPGKHFPGLTAAEQKDVYEGEAVEFTERHPFTQHTKGWGAAHTGPGIRFLCVSDVVDDPDHKGFWTTVFLWNRWRHETYKDNREAELQYLDRLPAQPTALHEAAAAATDKTEPAIKSWFDITLVGTHTIGGTGPNMGKTIKATWFACRTPDCKNGPSDPIKCTGTDTGALFGHLDKCNPHLAQRLRLESKHSPLQVDSAGEVYKEMTFDESLPHHARFVCKCFQGFDHFYETRANNGLLEYIKGFDRRATLPHRETCCKLLEARRASTRQPWH